METNALAAYKEEIAKELANQKSTLTTGGNAKIKAKNHTFTLPNGAPPSSDPLSVVIVEYTNSNAYFDTPYNPKDPKPPVCKARGKVIDDMVPAEDSTDKQSDACATCSLNQWGSAGDGSNRKGCTQSVTIALVSPESDKDSEPMTLNLPATSMKAFGNYVTKLGTLELLPAMMITEISFDTNVDYNKFIFKPVKPVEEAGTFLGLKADARAILG